VPEGASIPGISSEAVGCGAPPAPPIGGRFSDTGCVGAFVGDVRNAYPATPAIARIITTERAIRSFLFIVVVS